MFSKKDTPAQIEAGIKWINFEDLTPGVGQFNFARQKADGFPVGFPEPAAVRPAPTGTQDQPAAGRSPRRSTRRTTRRTSTRSEEGDGEPPTPRRSTRRSTRSMLAVLTEPNANIPALLKTAAANVNTHPGEQRG